MRFAKPASQAKTAAKQIAAHGKSKAQANIDHNRGIDTEKVFKNSIKQFVTWLQAQPQKACIDTCTHEQARTWLGLRAQINGQKQLQGDRRSLDKWFAHRDGVKPFQWRDYKDKAEKPARLAEQSRYYTPQQMKMVQDHQQQHNAFSTRIAYEAGLRAHELLTVARPAEQPADDRPWRDDKNIGQPDHKYTVIGKGGLIREIRLSPETARLLEATRRPEPVTVTDRDKNYLSRYDIAGGQSWSSSFTRASDRALGWTTGAHSTRHSYVQERMEQLQQRGYNWQDAREVVSQEVGHFSTQHIDKYLR